MTELNATAIDLYQDVVLDHKRSPRNFGQLASATNSAQGINPSCGDRVQVMLAVRERQIEAFRFEGDGCAICIASTSMMGEAISGRDFEHARALHRHFRAVLMSEECAEPSQLGKLVSLAGVRQYPSRIKCALLGWHALMQALGGDESQPQVERLQ